MAYRPQDHGAAYKGRQDQYYGSDEKEVAPYTSWHPGQQPGLELAEGSGHNDKHLVADEVHDSYKQPVLEVSPTGKYDDYRSGQEEKHVVIQQGKEVVQPDTGKVFVEQLASSEWPQHDTREPGKSGRLCGMKRKVFWVVLLVALLVLALAVGLGAGLAARQSSDKASSPSQASAVASASSPPASSSAAPTASATPEIGGVIDPSYYSRAGAWNGSGIAYVWQNFTQDWDDILRSNEYSHVVYFQVPSGEIHWMRETSDYSWKQGAPELLVVATDARNSTPISAVQYTANGTNYWNVFCKSHIAQMCCARRRGVLTGRPDIDNNNLVRQRSGNNRTDSWTDGSLSEAHLTAWNGDLIGLAACDSAINETIPLRLFYASNSTAFEEYLWFAGEDKWVWQQTWNNYSGAADVGCFGSIDGYRYVGLVSASPSNTLELWYQPEEDISADWQKGEFQCSQSPWCAIPTDLSL